MFKKFLSLSLILVCSVFIFSGCGRATYDFSENSNGSINISFKIELDKETIISGGGSQEFIDDVIGVAYKTLDNYKDTIMSNFYLKVNNTYPSPSEIKNWYLNDAVTCTINKKENIVDFSLMFYSTEVYYYFYGINEEDVDIANKDVVIEKHWLYNKVIQDSSTIYSNTIDTTSGNVNIVEYYNAEMYNYIKTNYSKTLADKFNQLDLIYSYTTYNTKLRADSDGVLVQNGYKTFVWKIDNNKADREIYFYRIVPNATSFYILGLGLTLIFMLIYFLISYFNNKKQEKIKLEKINQFKKDLNKLNDNIEEVINEKE